MTNKGIDDRLEDELYYSISYLRDTFSAVTGKSLKKYISRRIYTLILQNMSHKEFLNLLLTEKVGEINRFKIKCLKKFPDIEKKYCIENMQPKIDKNGLYELLSKRITEKGTKDLLKSLRREEFKNRFPIIISDQSEKVAIRTRTKMLIDLDKTYFIYKGYTFAITGNAANMLNGTKIKLMGVEFECAMALPANTNIILHMLHQMNNNCIVKTYATDLDLQLIHISDDYYRQCNLLGEVHHMEDRIYGMHFRDRNFLIFEENCVWLDVPFLDYIINDKFELKHSKERL